MSATEIIQQLPKLTQAERRMLLDRLQALVTLDDTASSGPSTTVQAAALTHLAETGSPYRAIDLPQRGVGEAQAADLRSRLKTFAEDWDRPEAAIYDEDPEG